MQTMGYDALGNITSKPGIGTYAYPAAGHGRPHAGASITGTVRGVTNPTFSYDGDGNQISGPGLAAGYTSFDMPAWVSSEQGGVVWGAFQWGQAAWSFTGQSLGYDGEHQRVSMGGTASTTYYFNDPVSGMTSEYVVPASGATQWRDYLIADGRMVAQRTIVTGGSASIQYFVADHLGSIAVSADASGVVLQRMIYDPWGQQLDQTGQPLCGSGAPTTRGFTGEEQFPVGCMVNLNARLYDPILGRFMAGDPVVSSVYDPLALNRYAYAHDNPLSLTDTDGQCGIFCVFTCSRRADVLGRSPICGPPCASMATNGPSLMPQRVSDPGFGTVTASGATVTTSWAMKPIGVSPRTGSGSCQSGVVGGGH